MAALTVNGHSVKKRRVSDRWLRIGFGTAGVVLVLAIWQLSTLWLNPILFSSPTRVAAALPRMFSSGRARARRLARRPRIGPSPSGSGWSAGWSSG